MESQLINYLKISQLQVGYLINFANKYVTWRRCRNQRE
jgi:GxxExxY protein